LFYSFSSLNLASLHRYWSPPYFYFRFSWPTDLESASHVSPLAVKVSTKFEVDTTIRCLVIELLLLIRYMTSWPWHLTFSPWSLVIHGGSRGQSIHQVWRSLRLSVLPAHELLPCVSNFCLNEWQEIWDCCEGNKLHSIYPTVGILKDSKNMSHYDSVLLNRLRIGHSRLTHSYLLCVDAPATCQSCGIPLTVKRISGMSQLAWHSWKILRGVFCLRLV